jgi:hypothetical protein
MSQKLKISAKQILADIKTGATNEFLMKKYGVSPKGLQSIFDKLIAAGVATTEIINFRGYEETAIKTDGTIVIAQLTGEEPKQFLCPACHMPQNKEFDICPQCGIIVEKFINKIKGLVEEPAETAREQTSPSKPIEGLQEKLKKVNSQVVGTAKKLQDSVTGSSAFAKVLKFVKVPKNTTIIGVTGLIVMILAGYLIYAKIEQRRQAQAALNRSFAEAIYQPFDRGQPIDVDLIKSLIDYGANVNTPIQSSPTLTCPPLYIAVGANDELLVKLLLDRGADPNTRKVSLFKDGSKTAGNGETPLMVAAQTGRPNIILMLLQAGADVDAEAENGTTALYHSTRAPSERISPARSLLESRRPKKSIEEVTRNVEDWVKKYRNRQL